MANVAISATGKWKVYQRINGAVLLHQQLMFDNISCQHLAYIVTRVGPTFSGIGIKKTPARRLESNCIFMKEVTHSVVQIRLSLVGLNPVLYRDTAGSDVLSACY